MTNPLVSLICPYFNREAYLKECINSLISQTYTPIEILLLNDGSDDCSEKIARHFNDERIRHIILPHQGCWKTKNQGIQQAKGDFLCFIDSDDLIEPDYIRSAIRIIKKNPLFQYYYPTALNIIEENGNKTNTLWRYLDYPINQRHQIISLFYHHLVGAIPHAGALIRKEVFFEKQYDDTLKNLADTVFVVKNALDIRFFMLNNQSCYFNRQHPKQTNKDNLARCKAYAELIFYIWKNYPSEYFLPDYKNPIDVAYQVFNYLTQLHENNKHICNDFLDQAKKVLLWIRSNEIKT
ncbi:MAG TPA: glycosyltransferase family 2 protein [Candidatus Cloacimonadota bacterium]|nr:glycosyltransferase family 2 protein [Candidatus Cloacimonadota bacterium]HPM02854.1 glycosyltransferase family 2 protein [Candidatus Cloacimonadota bacterium]